MGQAQLGIAKHRLATAGLLAAAALLSSVAPAQATFPGANGKLAYFKTVGSNTDVYVQNPDGTNVTRLTTDPASDHSPAWSADGTKIAFTSSRDGNHEIYVMNADGSGQVRLTQNPARDTDPTWSPDGTKIAFTSDRSNTCTNVPDCALVSDIYTMNSDGTSQTNITNGYDVEYYDPQWSPDGQRIAVTICQWHLEEDPVTEIEYYVRCEVGPDWGVMGADGGPAQPPVAGDWGAETNWSPAGQHVAYIFANEWVGDIGIRYAGAPCCPQPTYFTTDPFETDVLWSPDGTKLLFLAAGGAGVYAMNPDGTGVTQMPGLEGMESWQPLKPPGYARPVSATPTSLALVIAYKACTNPNGDHGPPLSAPSCSPVQESSYATVGHGDGHPTPSKATGRLVMKVVGESPINPSNGDQADVQLTAVLTDVRNLDFSDYTGELRVSPTLRITDRLNANVFSPPIHPGTTADAPFGFTASCSTTPDTTVGSTCSVTTTADAVMPGAVLEGKRTIWGLGQVQVYDGGADGDADTTGDNTLFAVQGLFTP